MNADHDKPDDGPPAGVTYRVQPVPGVRTATVIAALEAHGCEPRRRHLFRLKWRAGCPCCGKSRVLLVVETTRGHILIHCGEHGSGCTAGAILRAIGLTPDGVFGPAEPAEAGGRPGGSDCNPDGGLRS